MKWQTGNNWPATRHRRHDSETRSPKIQTLVLFKERRDMTAKWSEPSIRASDLGNGRCLRITLSAPRMGTEHREPCGKRNPQHCRNNQQLWQFLLLSPFHIWLRVWNGCGNSDSCQISPMWLIPTEMRWTKVKHYCNPMDSLTPPYRRAAFLRMWWLRETSNVLSGLWKYLWNNRDHLVKWEQKKNVFIYFPFL